jgi:hypothetical protein
MLKDKTFYCDKCGVDVSEEANVTLTPEFHGMPEEILFDAIDLCPACWLEIKRSFRPVVVPPRKERAGDNVVRLFT